MFQGAITALVTPFRDGALDDTALRRLVRHQIDKGASGVLIAGTTGEGVTLAPDERLSAIRIAVDEAGGALPIMAGTGTNDTRVSIEHTRAAAEAGASSALVVTPYYNKPTQAGLLAHFRAVADDGGLPVVLYNVPSRTGVSLAVDTIAELAEHPGIVAIKEASADMRTALEINARCRGRLQLLSGDDFTILPFLACGGRGVISVVSNVAPFWVAELINSFNAHDVHRARTIQQRILPLASMLFVESNPIPVKAALAEMGMCRNELRLPLVPMSDEHLPALRQALGRLDLLPKS